MRKGIGKRILAVFLAVFMVFSVIPTTAFAGSDITMPGPVLNSVHFSAAENEISAMFTGQNMSSLSGAELYMLTKKELLNGMGYWTINNVIYYILGIQSLEKKNLQIEGDNITVTNSFYFGPNIPPVNGETVYIGVTTCHTFSDVGSIESEMSNLIPITIEGGEEAEEWVWVYNELMHWEKCIKGANTGSERSEGQHVFSETNKKKLYIDTSSYSPLRPLSAQNSPVLLDDDGGRYVFDGTGFTDKNNKSTQSVTALTTYYTSNFAGVNFRDYYVTATPCSECSYLGFDLDTDRAVFETDNFTASIDNPVTAEGQWVYLTVDGIAEGVDLSVTATDGEGNDVELTEQNLQMLRAVSTTTSSKKYVYQMPASNVIITIAEQATLTYDANEGQGDVPEKQTVTPGTSVEVASANLSKDDSSFVYWNTEPDGSGDTYYIGDSITVSANTTLYAQYGGILFIDVPADYVTSIGEPFILIDLTDYGLEGDDFYVYGLPVAVGDDLTAAKTAIENAEINVNVNNVELSGWMYLDAGSQSILALDSLPATMPQTNLIVAIPTFALTGSFAVGDTITVPPTMAATYWENDWYFDEDWKIELGAGVYTLEYVGYNPEDPEYPEDPDYHTFLIVDTQDEDNYHYLDLNANGVSDKPWGVTCVSGTGTEDEPYLFGLIPGYTVTYDGNGATGGEAPVDGKVYLKDKRVVTLDHGTLEKTGFSFKEWNTAADGSGTAYAERSSFIIAGKTTLYAQWTESGSDTSEPDNRPHTYTNIQYVPSGTTGTTNTDSNNNDDTTTPAKDDKDAASVDGAFAHDPDKVIERTAAAKEGDIIIVRMPADDTVLPKEALENIMGKDITLVIELPGVDVTWTINGKDVTAPKDVDLGITTMNNEQIGVVAADLGIPVEVINLITGEKEILYMHLNHDGDFGFIATLKVNLKNAGMYANLFYLTENATMPEFLDSCVIDKDGCAEFRFTHASDYFIVIDDVPFDAAEDEIDDTDDTDVEITDDTVSETPVEVITAPASDGNPHTGAAMCGTAVLAAGAAALAAALAKKRRNK